MPARRGRKPSIPPDIDYAKSEWVPGWPETPMRDRIGSKKNKNGEKCPYSIKTTKSMQKKGITPDVAALMQINKLFTKMGVRKATIFWDVFTDEQAVDEDVALSRVKIMYSYQGASWFMLQDKFKAPLANLRACIEAIDGIYRLSKSQCIHDFSKIMNRFETQLVVRETKRPSKAIFGWEPEKDYQAILELQDEELTIQVDSQEHGRLILPSMDVLKRRFKDMRYFYHPDRQQTCPDEYVDEKGNVFAVSQDKNGKEYTKKPLSFQLIGAAGAFVESQLRMHEACELPSYGEPEAEAEAEPDPAYEMSEANKLARERARQAMEFSTSTICGDREPTDVEMEVLAEDEAQYYQSGPDEDYSQI